MRGSDPREGVDVVLSGEWTRVLEPIAEARNSRKREPQALTRGDRSGGEDVAKSATPEKQGAARE